ncbi:hypothetical protein [Taibaiella koreensis]|uniref:hypothetical protein n=1 Tax=Taibaiella koreensis TaxID=1268548 RepID=UPI000E59E18C|nr:hypothetical protein [Taibaiella koreensis]
MESPCDSHTAHQETYRVNGHYKKRFSFQYENRHWISGNMAVCSISGTLDRGLVLRNEEEGTQKWSFGLQDVQFNRDEGCIPEVYFLFDLYRRIDFKIDKEGRIIAWEIPKEDGDPVKKWEALKPEIRSAIQPVERAMAFYTAIRDHITNDRLMASVLEHHILFDLFRRIGSLEQFIRTDADSPSFPFRLQKVDYFGKDLPLPIKACWLQKPVRQHRDYLWINTGGLDETAFKQKEYQQALRALSGNSISDTTLQLEYSQLYDVYRPFLEYDFLEIRKAESFLETAVPGAWYKSEWTTITETAHPFTG